MPKSETNVPIMTRSKKEGTFNDPKLSLNEVKNEATSKTITEKDKVDTPVVKQVQPMKEVMKTDVQVEKNMMDQSVEKKTEKKFVIEKSTDKDRSSSKNVESLILEKNKPKDPSALKKDESLIHEKNKPKEENRSTMKKDECSILEKNKPKENVRSSSKKDESLFHENNKPKEEVHPFAKKDESLFCEKNKPKEENLFASKKDESLIPEKNVPKEEVRSFTKKDEYFFLETNKSKEEVRSSTKKDESPVLEKNVVKEEVRSSSKKDEFCVLEKNIAKEELRSSSKKDEFCILEKNKPKEEDRSCSKKDEFLILEKNVPKEELRPPSKKDESVFPEKNKPKEEVRSSSQKDEFVIVEKNKPKEDDQPSSKKEEFFIVEKNKPFKPANVAVPRKSQPYVPPITNESPIVLATHLVPSLPVALFELLAEVIEVATERPVNLLYEPRSNRKVAKNITDIAILSANEEWEDGNLLPVSFIFKHRLNKDNSPSIYADVIIASDLTPHVEDIIDMRGYRCALPDRSKKVGATTLLYNYLHTVGEGPAFFGNTLDVDSQIAVLQMVAGKQAEVGILEAPVIMCHKDTLPGIESLRIVTSLGPLPPYRIMVNKTLSDNLVRKLTSSLLNCNQDVERMEKLASFGILGFAINSTDFYEFSDVKSAIKRGPYY
ncbi:cytadherence high molecular weight protein 1-like isoform X6 [Vespula pensylvanica]|uniref:cytadherence high molecular weight protein 1-like isoform X6 n=1 Tax=Vespula pensylvanica TaxID=30213 RepID=UPI001CBA447E|nr:cytadherence high molecular weight protein 1-like isoform X6 [Vespula pensylvanica]